MAHDGEAGSGSRLGLGEALVSRVRSEDATARRHKATRMGRNEDDVDELHGHGEWRNLADLERLEGREAAWRGGREALTRVARSTDTERGFVLLRSKQRLDRRGAMGLGHGA